MSSPGPKQPKFAARVVRALAVGIVLATVLNFGLAVPLPGATSVSVGAALAIEISKDFEVDA